MTYIACVKIIAFLDVLYRLMLVIALCSSIVRYKGMDTASRVLCFLLGISVITEIVAYYSAKKYHTNLAIYTIYTLVEFSLISMYFNYSIDFFYKHKLGIYIGAIGLLLGVANIIFLQPINQINSYFLFFESITIIAMCFTAFARLTMLHDQLQLLKYHHFWFLIIITFFWCSTFLNSSLYKYIVFTLGKNGWILLTLNLIENIVTYCSFAIVFLLYPKMQQQDE
jgi:hypothetical protein